MEITISQSWQDVFSASPNTFGLHRFLGPYCWGGEDLVRTESFWMGVRCQVQGNRCSDYFIVYERQYHELCDANEPIRALIVNMTLRVFLSRAVSLSAATLGWLLSQTVAAPTPRSTAGPATSPLSRRRERTAWRIRQQSYNIF